MKKLAMTFVFAASLVSVSAFAAAKPEASPLAYEAIQKGQWTEAEALLRQGLAQNPDDATRLLNLAFVLQNTGRQTEAASVYQHVLKLGSNPMVAVDDPYTLPKATPAKRIAKKGIASLETASR